MPVTGLNHVVLYAHDPGALEFGWCWLLPAEIERYGADTRGGAGVSIVAVP